jgi:hypothetical protein
MNRKSRLKLEQAEFSEDDPLLVLDQRRKDQVASENRRAEEKLRKKLEAEAMSSKYPSIVISYPKSTQDFFIDDAWDFDNRPDFVKEDDAKWKEIET